MRVLVSYFLIGHLYLVGVWLGEDQRTITVTIRTRVQKRMDYVVIGILCRMHNSVNYPILRCMLGYTKNQQLHFIISFISCHLTFNCPCYCFGMSMFYGVRRCMLMLHNGLQVDQSIHKWHLPLMYWRISNPWKLTCKMIISSISKCHAKCYNVNIFYFIFLLWESFLCWWIESCW